MYVCNYKRVHPRFEFGFCHSKKKPPDQTKSKQYTVALWLETRNLNHLPFGMILNLDIRLRHPSRLPRHKISQKKWKRPKKFFEGHIKGQIQKKWFFNNFFALIGSNGLENSANVVGLTFKAIKTKKATQRPNIRKSHIWKRRTQILLP